MVLFGAVKTRAELSIALGVPDGALDLVVLSEKPCKERSCLLPSVEHNYGKCVAHSQNWYPREKNADGTDAKYKRGHFLFGPQYMRRYDGKVRPSCCCTDPTCEGIGYSHCGMERIPSKPAEANRFLDKLPGMTATRKKEILANPSGHKVAPGHFLPQHRYRDTKGIWRIKKEETYRDNDGHTYKFAPPNNRPQDFIDAEIKNPIQGHDRTCVYVAEADTELPSWVNNLSKVEPANGTIVSNVSKTKTKNI